MLCLASILLRRPYVVWVYGMYAVEVGLSLVLAVHVAGSMVHRICWSLYPLTLKTMDTATNSESKNTIDI
jgi:hypothetical protein